MGSEDGDDGRKFWVSRRIMIVAIAFLLGVMMGIILLNYARYLRRRQERRRRASALLNSQGITQIAAIGESPINDEPPKSGLDPLVIASLPTLTYKLIITGMQRVDDDEPRECSVCLGTITEQSTVKVLPNCKHMFHVECIDTWLGSHTTCPMCRTVADPTVQVAEAKELGSSVQPTAPPLDENESHSAAQAGSGSRFGSFRGMLGKERSSSRIQSRVDEVTGTQDL